MKLNVINNLRLIPGFTGDVGIGVNYLFDAPVYWQLPNQFLGDRVRHLHTTRISHAEFKYVGTYAAY